MLPTEKQLWCVLKGMNAPWGSLYQGVHPESYGGYNYAWASKMDVIIDVDGYFPTSSEPSMGCVVVRWKIEDGPLPDRNLLDHIADFAATCIKNNKNVLVHCAAGQNRSSLVVACVMRKIFPAMTGEEIYKVIKGKNPMALTNQSFRDFVQTIDKM